MTGEPFVARCHERLDGSPRSMRELPLVLFDEVVELDEVDMVDPKPIERALEARPRGAAEPVLGFGGKEEPAPVLRHPGGEPELGVTVGRSYVDVVDAELKEEGKELVGAFLPHPTERGGSKNDPAARMCGPAEGRGFDGARIAKVRHGG